VQVRQQSGGCPYESMELCTYPISPVTGIVTVGLTVEILHHVADCKDSKLSSGTLQCLHCHPDEAVFYTTLRIHHHMKLP